MSKRYKGFEPNWYREVPPRGSYRSIFKWGDPAFNKVPKEALFKMMKETFHLTDDDFKSYAEPLGLDLVKLDKPVNLFVADFIGADLAIFRGATLAEEEGNIVVKSEENADMVLPDLLSS